MNIVLADVFGNPVSAVAQLQYNNSQLIIYGEHCY
jgi:hypothetical protein